MTLVYCQCNLYSLLIGLRQKEQQSEPSRVKLEQPEKKEHRERDGGVHKFDFGVVNFTYLHGRKYIFITKKYASILHGVIIQYRPGKLKLPV
ncbi:uncharacterized protein LOC119682018 isoform X1 [Teleopsis dalmanni]|uniref:uncharacterized protein LOC119682018 isoform X1 n=1 Tax=Teleopsis dalmanni TaxID=139649 RepID=UPI0018CD243B|nr:uncharacterized protein LOC119682018 isoform X1 [Teleopsis dalmanni]